MTPQEYRRLRTLFLEARSLAPAARRELLESAEVDDEMRRRLERMLGRESESGIDTEDRPSLWRESLEDSFGPYRIRDVLGAGGFSIVYRAEQERPVRRQVALKLVKPGLDARGIVKRFEAEGQALALLNHPSIARVFDFGTTESGRPYLVMELVSGEPIARYCDDRALSIRSRLSLFLEVCSGIRHAHQRAIIHRDLKPANVLVTEVDARPTVKVIDFGIAKSLEARLVEDAEQTRAGQLMGTPGYMSPEQLEGREDIDTRTDVYSLGVLLQELLLKPTPLETGRVSSSGAAGFCPPRLVSTLESLDGEEAREIASRRGCEVASLAQQLRGDLEWIVQTAVADDRERRYESVAALSDDVERHIRSEPVLARPPSFAYRLRKAWARRRGWILAAAVFFVTGLVALGLVLASNVETRAALSRSEGLRFTALATGLSDSNPDLALQLALEGHERYASSESRGALLEVLANLVEHRSFVEHSGPVYACAVSADGRLVASSDSTALYLWESRSGQRLREIREGARHTRIRFSSDGQRLFSASGEGHAIIADSETGVVEFQVDPPGGARAWVEWSERGRAVVRLDSRGQLRGWSESGEFRGTVDAGLERASAAALSTDGRHVVLGTGAGRVVVWDWESARKVSEFSGIGRREAPVAALEFNPGGDRILVATTLGVAVHDATSGAREFWLDGNEPLIRCADWSADGSLLAAGSDGRHVVVWDALRGGELRRLGDLDAKVLAVEFSADSTRLVSATSGKDAYAQDLSSERGPIVLRSHRQKVTSLGLSADGRVAVTASPDGWASAWRLDSRPVPLCDYEKDIAWFDVSRDGQTMVSAGRDGRVALWDLWSGRLLSYASGHKGDLLSAEFVDGDDRVVSVSTDRTVRVWDLNSGAELARYPIASLARHGVLSPEPPRDVDPGRGGGCLPAGPLRPRGESRDPRIWKREALGTRLLFLRTLRVRHGGVRHLLVEARCTAGCYGASRTREASHFRRRVRGRDQGALSFARSDRARMVAPPGESRADSEPPCGGVLGEVRRGRRARGHCGRRFRRADLAPSERPATRRARGT